MFRQWQFSNKHTLPCFTFKSTFFIVKSTTFIASYFTLCVPERLFGTFSSQIYIGQHWNQTAYRDA